MSNKSDSYIAEKKPKQSHVLIQKYGGATLSTPEKIKSVANRIFNESKKGNKVVAVVSAMGKTTNQLLDLANQVSSRPSLRELDMLLTTGERISTALVSMALNDLGASAISLTGSQAGIMTDDSHLNAKITDVKAFRVDTALEENKIVVLAGFQGVSPATKEITTLGRGGSDSTAIKSAAYLNANRCEILKDVAGVFTADPNIVASAKPIKKLNYEQLGEMTFWGAKVLHHRSVDLAKLNNVTLYIGPAAESDAEGTLIQNEEAKEFKLIGLNTFDYVIELSVTADSIEIGRGILQENFKKLQIANPHYLKTLLKNGTCNFLITGPNEIKTSILKERENLKSVLILNDSDATITLTFSKAPTPSEVELYLEQIKKLGVYCKHFIQTELSITLLIDKSLRDEYLEKIHALISKD